MGVPSVCDSLVMAMQPCGERPKRAVSKYWWVQTTRSSRTHPSKEELKAGLWLYGTAIVVGLLSYYGLTFIFRLLGIDRDSGAVFSSILLVSAAIALGLGFWLARPICDWLKPMLMKKADENAARRFMRDLAPARGGDGDERGR